MFPCNEKFFIINGDVPILVGNDILEPLGGVIDMDENIVEFKHLDRTVEMFKTSGGHYVVPVTKRCEENPAIEPEHCKTIEADKGRKYEGCSEPDESSNEEVDVKDIESGIEQDAVMLVMFAESSKVKDLVTCYLLLVTCYLLLVTCYLLLVTCYLLS